jgi:predicted ATPase/DNA-binding SARP family transcriptional activator
MPMQFETLGPLRVVGAVGPLALGGPAERRLLAVLLVCPNAPVTDDRLIDELWGEGPPRSARHLLRVYASRLRKALSPEVDGAERIVRESDGYLLRTAPGEVDADRFAAAVADGRELQEGNPEAAHVALTRGLQLWRGDGPFADLVDPPPSVRDRAAYLERLRREGTSTWIDLGLRLGQHHALIPEISALVASNPYDEELHAQLMLALYRCGRQADALTVARDLQTRLREELGVDSSAAVRDLYRDILLQAPQLALEPPEPPTNLPRPSTSFVGRSREVADVVELLGTNRLVTLTGTGGIGKTRLAIEAAVRERSRFPGGVWWVDLAPAADPGLVIDEVARVIGLSRVPGADLLEALTRALRRRRMLLLIDNCEHVADAVAALAAALLRETVVPRIIATSRVPLHADGEALFAVPALGLPPSYQVGPVADADAVRLFAERSRAADPGFVLDAGNIDAVAELCRRLDGLPLAIEMAAARVRVLTPMEIGRLLHQRLALLALPSTDTPDRHRTLKATIDASYALLGQPERVAFERLSVFVGPFDLDAAAAVGMIDSQSSEVVKVLGALVDASMLGTERNRGTRYRMLETIRAYGLGRLERRGTARETRAAHARHYLALAECAGQAVETPSFASWMGRLDETYDELRQALDWSMTHARPADALSAAPALREFWFQRGDAREAGRWSARMLAGNLEAVPTALLAEAHHAATMAAGLTNDLATATLHAEAAVRLARDSGSHSTLVSVLWGRGNIAFASGDIGAVRANATEALEVAQGLPQGSARARPLSSLGLAALARGALDEAAARFEEAIPLYRELGDRAGLVITALSPRSGVAIAQKDLVAAEWYAS